MTELESLQPTPKPLTTTTTTTTSARAAWAPDVRSALAAFDQETRAYYASSESEVSDQQSRCERFVTNALILIQHHELALAKHLLRAALAINSYSAPALRALGHCFQQEKQFALAEKCFAQLALVREDEHSYFLLAQSQYQGGQDRPAQLNYRRALALIRYESSMLFEIYKNLGNIAVRLGDFDAAEENYNRAYTLNPDSAALMVNYGILEIQRENYADAVVRLRSAVGRNQDNDQAWVGLALVHNQHGDYQLALANLERALDLNSQNETALRLLIEWSVRRSDYDRALARLRTYVDRGGEDLTLVQWLAQILLIKGCFDEASFEIERVLATNPQALEAEQLAEEIRRHQARQPRWAFCDRR